MKIAQIFLIYIVNATSILLVLVSYYFNIKRHKNIEELPTTVISKSVKISNLNKLQKNTKIFKVALILNIINLLVPNGLLKFLLPALTIVLVSNILVQLFEEIDTFNITKGQIDMVDEFKEKRNQEIRQKIKEREARIRKEKESLQVNSEKDK